MPKLVIFYYYAVFENWNVSILTFIVMPGSYIYFIIMQYLRTGMYQYQRLLLCQVPIYLYLKTEMYQYQRILLCQVPIYIFEDWNVSISTYIVMPWFLYIYIFEDWNVLISTYIVMPGSYIYI